MSTPRLEIDLDKIAHNTRTLIGIYGNRGIRISAVTKAVCGEPRVARVLVDCGIRVLADSRLANIRRMQDAGVEAEFLLLRCPSISQATEVVAHAGISLNSELSVIRELSDCALEQGRVHKVILMIELGDLREGMMPSECEAAVEEVLTLTGVTLAGIGVNLACFGGIRPDDDNMGQLSAIARGIERRFGVELERVSGGNSANHAWFVATADVGMINDLRIGESIYLGCETLFREPIEGLFTDAFTLVAEVIESRLKPSVPHGRACQNAAGVVPVFEDHGDIRRVILAIGSQDVGHLGLTPRNAVRILGSSGDHTVVDAQDLDCVTGDELAFGLDYGALLAAMTSPYVDKVVV